MSEEKTMPFRLFQMAKAIGNETRFQIIQLLKKNTLFCGDLVEELGIPQSTVSHHLKILRETGIVYAEEQGSYVCYQLNYEAIKELGQWLLEFCAENERSKSF